MASTIQLQRTVNVAQIMVRQAPLTGVGGVANEPAFTIGDWVRQFIVGPPFAWRWNRIVQTFNTVVGQQDYNVTPSSPFGWLEKATVTDASNQSHELQIAMSLGTESTQNLPISIAALVEGSPMKFRLLPVPDKTYTVELVYQAAAPIFTNLTDTWAPIPDYLSYLYNQGFTAKAYEYIDPEKFLFSMQLFVKQVIAANNGLTDSQINIFMQEFVNSQRTIESATGNSQSGRAGRGLFQ